MTDIVERLRDEADPAVNESVDRLLEAAADEIERLRRVLQQAGLNDYHDHHPLGVSPF